MSSTKVSEIIKTHITPQLLQFKGLSSQALTRKFKQSLKVSDISVYNNIRLKAKMMGLITSPEEAKRFVEISKSVNQLAGERLREIQSKLIQQ